MSVGPLRLAFYKGITGKYGAIQFNPQMPHYYVKTQPSLKNFDGRFIPDNWLGEEEGNDPEAEPKYTVEDLASREGAIFLEITSAKDKNVYDWNKKIVFALSITDIGKWIEVLEGSKTEAKLMHDPGAKSTSQGKVKKYLDITSPAGVKDKGCVVIASEVMAGSNTPIRHTIPLSSDECVTLRCAMQSFIAKALGWA